MSKQIVETLQVMRDGAFLQELEIQVRDVVEAVKTNNKKGKVTITLSFTPGKANMLLVEDDIKIARPEPDRDRSTVFFPTEANDLSRRDPRQPSLLPPATGPRVVPMAASSEGGQP